MFYVILYADCISTIGVVGITKLLTAAVLSSCARCPGRPLQMPETASDSDVRYNDILMNYNIPNMYGVSNSC